MATKKKAAEAATPEPEEVTVEVIEETVEPVAAEPEVPASVRALPGDNYLTIAERYGLNARELLALNCGAPVTPGARIVLK